MPSRSYADFLLDIRDNALLAQQWTASHTRETFRQDQQVFYAVTRCLEIISEATRRLPQELRDSSPDLPWRAIMDAGNVYRHRYDNVAEDNVWRTVQHSLPSLLAFVDSAIADMSAIASARPARAVEPPEISGDHHGEEPDDEP